MTTLLCSDLVVMWERHMNGADANEIAADFATLAQAARFSRNSRNLLGELIGTEPATMQAWVLWNELVNTWSFGFPPAVRPSRPT